MAIEPPPGFRSSGEPPSGTRIVLIRHGEANCNVAGLVGGPVGCSGLSELGRRQATALRERLAQTGEMSDVTALYSSVLPRAIETLAILAPALPPLDPETDCDVCEMHPGEADGLTWDEMIATFGGVDWGVDPEQPFSPGGESWSGMSRRVRAALERLGERHEGERIIIATHGGVIEHAMKWAQGCDDGVRLQLRTEHCSMMELELTARGPQLLRYNDRAPLPAR
jgi:probable phosphoglycerate mutase